MIVSDEDQALRGHLTRAIAELGHAPSTTALAARAGLSIEAADIDPWCARHCLPRGAVMTLSEPWHKRTPDEVRALFAHHRLVGAFWAISSGS